MLNASLKFLPKCISYLVTYNGRITLNFVLLILFSLQILIALHRFIYVT